MAKLWQKGYDVLEEIEAYTVGNDYIIDKDLLEWDIFGSLAHAAMLKKIGILKESEHREIRNALKAILDDKAFEILPEDEDVHTAIENYLIKQIGDAGKKLHTARSRNDQVLLDIRLYAKEHLLFVKEAALNLCETLAAKAEEYKEIPLPGYTHTRKAMPSSVGLWLAAFAESLLDDVELINTALQLNDRSPLGSAAGYGVPIAIDREYVAELLGFASVQNNVLYCANSRGKIEEVILHACVSVMLDLGRLATDIIWFSTDEFGFITLPDEITTGSSIMPQKKNPDVLELMRGKAALVEGYESQARALIRNQFSGYNRDYQLTKEPLMLGLKATKASLSIMQLVIGRMAANASVCEKACTKELYAADAAYEFVRKGMPFREAYQKIGADIQSLKAPDRKKALLERIHSGSSGNLGLDGLKSLISKGIGEFRSDMSCFEGKITRLLRL